MSPALITDGRPSVEQSSVVDKNAFARHRADAYGMIGTDRLAMLGEGANRDVRMTFKDAKPQVGIPGRTAGVACV